MTFSKACNHPIIEFFDGEVLQSDAFEIFTRVLITVTKLVAHYFRLMVMENEKNTLVAF